jgi:hypothetical protein
LPWEQGSYFGYLPGAYGSDDAEELSRFHGEGNVVEGGLVRAGVPLGRDLHCGHPKNAVGTVRKRSRRRFRPKLPLFHEEEGLENVFKSMTAWAVCVSLCNETDLEPTDGDECLSEL